MTTDAASCPAPLAGYERVVLAHGGGGRLMHRLIEDLFRREFGASLQADTDGAALALSGECVFTTDSFVVQPLCFPGGDIGRLAVAGTINDLAVCGARPDALAVAFILEEGLPIAQLALFVESMAKTARAVGANVVTGDTKVVERGKGDGVFITTTGVGRRVARIAPGPHRVAAGDVVIVSGPVGDHGMAVLAARHGLEFDTPVVSDVAPIWPAVSVLISSGIDVHCMRDPTRGGLASALSEIAAVSRTTIAAAEASIPVRPAVADGCELLGLDPLYVACEGRFVAFVASAQADDAVAILKENGCPEAVRIGRVEAGGGRVILESSLGGSRQLDMLAGEQLPRIC